MSRRLRRLSRKDSIFALVLAVTGVSASPPPVYAQSDAALRRLAERYWEAKSEHNPLAATANGDYRFNDRLEDLSVEGVVRWRERLRTLLREVRRIDPTPLDREDRLTHRLLERSLEDDITLTECDLELTPLEPLDGPHLRLPLVLVAQPFRDEQDFLHYMDRLRAFPKQVDDLIAAMRVGMARNIVPPCVVIRKVVPQLRTQIVEDPRRSVFFKPAREAVGLAESARTRLSDALAAVIKDAVTPAYARLLAFVEKEYLPVCRESVGVGQRPGGEQAYRKLIRIHTTVELTPEEVHEIGLREVRRLRDRMADVQREIGFEGSLDAFIAHMRTHPAYRFRSGAELIRAADAILQRTKPQLPKLFGRLPKADIVMKEIESFRAAASPAGYYNPPPEDGSRPAYYYINTYAAQERPRYTLEALSYHEAVPGHHLQIALHTENRSLPKFRRYAGFTAFVEGWALYSEQLGYDLGGYTTPEDRFGQLTFEMWRACRLVVDTGMHAKGWTRDQAVAFMSRNTALGTVDIHAEIDRYIAWPGQALAYKIGELRIAALRRKAERTLGARFDVRAFHDALLADGPMPIDILEQRMNAWLQRQAE